MRYAWGPNSTVGYRAARYASKRLYFLPDSAAMSERYSENLLGLPRIAGENAPPPRGQLLRESELV